MDRRLIGTTVTGVVVVCVLAWGLVSAQVGERRVRLSPVQGAPPMSEPLGGPVCALEGNVTEPLTWIGSGNTCSDDNTISVYANANCPAFDYPGPDLAYRMAVGPTNDITSIVLTPTSPADLGVFLISDCTVGTSCIDFEDIVGGGSVSSINSPSPLASGAYYIYVDSYYAAGAESCGDYMLEVNGTMLPVELLEFDVE